MIPVIATLSISSGSNIKGSKSAREFLGTVPGNVVAIKEVGYDVENVT